MQQSINAENSRKYISDGMCFLLLFKGIKRNKIVYVYRKIQEDFLPGDCYTVSIKKQMQALKCGLGCRKMRG